MIAPLITLLNVTKRYLQGNVPVVALRDVSVTIEAGECVAIMGSSGSGKSTLLNLIGCIDVPTYGSVCIDGQLTTHLTDAELTVLRRDKVGMIFQFFNLLGTLTARQNVALPMLITGLPRQQAWRGPTSYWPWSASRSVRGTALISSPGARCNAWPSLGR